MIIVKSLVYYFLNRCTWHVHENLRRPSDITVFYYNFWTLKGPVYPQSVYG